MPTFPTAGEVLNDAAVELALLTADMTDAYAATDAAVVQMRRLLKSLGQDLAADFRWTHLQKTYFFVTTAGVDTYELPADFGRLLDGTEWNRTQQMPLGGPVNPQGWQQLKAQTSTGTVWLNFRIAGNKFLLHPVPSSTQSIAFEYISTRWVQDATEAAPSSDTPDAHADVLWFHKALLVAGLKYRFLAAKGFATANVQRLYEDALAAAQGGDGAAPALSIDRCTAQPWDVPINAFGPIGGGGSSGGGGGGGGSLLESGLLESGGLF